MQQNSIEIINKLGLHARAATKLAKTANQYASKITVEYAGKAIDGKSIMSLMLLAAAKGCVIKITTEGQDEELAMQGIQDLINNRFEEEE